MKHLSLARLSILGGAPIIEDQEESRHLKYCEHCMRLLRWFADERINELRKREELQQTLEDGARTLTTVH
jgi:hypothetical protein